MERFIQKVLTVTLFIMLFFTPLIFVKTTYEGFEFPKMQFIYLVGGLYITIGFLKKVWFDEKWAKLNLWALGFVLIYAVSTVLSSNFDTSFWGYYTRFNGGLVSVLVFYGIYLVTLNNFSVGDLLPVLKLSLVNLVPLAFYALSQKAESGFSADLRVFSTFGQPNWLAAYLVLVIPVVLHFTLVEKTRFSKAWGVVVYGLAFFTLWTSQSISGLFGFAVMGIYFSGLYFSKIKDNLYPAAAIAIVSLLIVVLVPSQMRQRIQDAATSLQSNITKTAYAQNEYNVSDSGSIRKGLWKGTVNLATSSLKVFFIGTGPETFPYEFQSFRPLNLNYSSEWDFVFNKPHNYYLELVSNTGIFSLAIYLGLIWKLLRTGEDFAKTAIAGFAVTNVFGWPTVSTALLFWVFLALSETQNGQKSQKKVSK